MTSAADAAVLPLPDALLLLALDDERGTRARSTELEPGLGGAVLLELALARRVDVVARKVVVLDPTPTGDSVVDALLARIAAAPKPRSAQHWVEKAQKGVRQAVADRLVAAGTLRRERVKVLGLFPVTRLPSVDPAPEAALRQRLDDAVRRGLAPDARTASVAALVHVTGLQRTVLPTASGAERRELKRRLEVLAEGDWAAEAVRRAIADIAAATTAAAVAASSAAATGSS